MTEVHHKQLLIFSIASSVIVFVLILLGVVYKIPAFQYDDVVGGAIRLALPAGILPTMLFITNLASPLVLLVIGLAAYAFLLWYRSGYYDLVLIVATVIGGIFTVLLKWLLDVPRPMVHLVLAFDPSFPSGHTAMSAVVFLVIAYAFRHEIQRAFPRALFEFSCFAVIALIALSRVYLGAHRPTEVVAGFLLGVFSVSVALYLFRALESRAARSL